MSGKRDNIGSIHWYNRRKVTKENQPPYNNLPFHKQFLTL